ncbi:MBL fold metallo-hydrolase [Paenibacillus psychroresistens]|uniref:MBL fold metallo-hydrolase n=1 Tax=Paenibacillus psychroresistens TaxID=1778678 RepID=UPI001390D86E|nr:MBL fold metallo-hydrolase [Paenibacillus psychroresistens]
MKFKNGLLLSLLLLAVLGIQACSKTKPAASPDVGATTAVTASSAPTTAINSATPAPTEMPTPVPEPDQLDIVDTTSLVNTTGKTIFKNYSNSKGEEAHTTVAIVSSKGTVILADPYDLPKKKGIPQADIVTSSHGHADHHDNAFEGRTTARMSNNMEDSFTVKDVSAKGIVGSHRDNVIEEYSENSNTIYVFEVDGIRIAHTGDLGQDELTPEQLKKLGKIDILFTRFSNKTDYGASAQQSITVITQLKPKIVLPTHYELDTVDLILKELNITDRSETETLTLDLKDIQAIKETKYIFLT